MRLDELPIAVSQAKWKELRDAGARSLRASRGLIGRTGTIEYGANAVFGFTATVALIGAVVLTGGAAAGALAIPAVVVYSAVGGVMAYGIVQAGRERYKVGHTLGQSAAGGVSDFFGATEVYAGLTERDLITGAELDLEPGEAGRALGAGSGKLVAFLLAPGQFRAGQARGAAWRTSFQARFRPPCAFRDYFGHGPTVTPPVVPRPSDFFATGEAISPPVLPVPGRPTSSTRFTLVRLGKVEPLKLEGPGEVAPTRVAPNLPAYSGGKTSGVLRYGDTDVPLLSGYKGPSASMPKGSVPGMHGRIKSHVEAHAASVMRQQNLKEATLYINCIPCPTNNPRSPGCFDNLPKMLPEGARLRVIGPDGFDHVFVGLPD